MDHGGDHMGIIFQELKWTEGICLSTYLLGTLEVSNWNLCKLLTSSSHKKQKEKGGKEERKREGWKKQKAQKLDRSESLKSQELEKKKGQESGRERTVKEITRIL